MAVNIFYTTDGIYVCVYQWFGELPEKLVLYPLSKQPLPFLSYVIFIEKNLSMY